MARVPGAAAMRETPLHASVLGSSFNAKLVAPNSSSGVVYGRNGFFDCNLSAASAECEFFCRASSAGELCSPSSRVSILNSTVRRGSRASGRVLASAVEETGKSKSGGRFYFNVTGFPFPLGPFLSRRTIRTEMQRGSIWLFEQEQALGFSSVTTNTRMTVIKLKSGGLWVHAPIGPTDECIQLLKELELPIEYIVLPTFAYEHKIFVGPFSRAFPKAQVWVAPRQWSWPLNLPLPFLGIFGAKVLKDDELVTPWADEIEHKILSCPEVGIGPYVEVAFYHKASRSLLVTDAVIFVPDKPPSVVSKEALLDAARNGLAVKVLSAGKEVPDDPIVDNEENRQRGWERMVLQILFLGPSNLLEPTQSFRQMSKKLIVSPIVKTLVYNKVPDKVKIWVDSIARDWKFKQIIPCHFSGPVAADARVFKAAFAFLSDLVEEKSGSSESPLSSLVGFFGRAAAAVTYPTADMKTLSSLDNFLVSTGAVKKTVSGKKKK
ncbi:hypothetical protein MPTK1_2g07530 [Marchantia polymorpha subsp. ruderalis]|uniref:DUF4336 domain-containing protein n=1 Tax=Marchantia polymorpha TaxID=3197 RepID=A0A2R6XGJ0_MARPO|nr:hypothetical protein MARPO_0015s0039 [Marchantia polymorpha]BBN01456.1 hypothetical protein Mp_2g07530 [Marchantia polymorpha subsp. ruderalis]|eukprot:PTQ45225.1 hypothetical protein MARPO_0015s0039 [Marchantia polymorpha]